MPYTLNFSDLSNPNTITVPDMPPGANTVDTSLTLIGKSYPLYGEKTAENFLHLLENFASPYPGPNNPIEGQLWYDTSDPNHKVLRVRDGINWSNVSGVYQQSDDPRTSVESPAKLRAGDIWVDTSNYQLKIFNNNDWTLVGPMVTEGNTTGLSVETIFSTGDIPGITQGHPIIKLWAEGDVVAIVTSRRFTPRTVIPGFSELLPGINLRNTSFGVNIPAPIINGTVRTAKNLEIDGLVVNSNKVLRKDDYQRRSQIITGKVYFKTSTESINDSNHGRGDEGIVINNQSSVDDTRYIQFYKGGSNAIILNNDPAGKIVLQSNNGSLVVSLAEINSDNFTIDVPSTFNKPVTIQSSTTINGNFTVTSTATIAGGLTVEGSTIINDDVVVTGRVILKKQDNFGNPSAGPALIPHTSGIYSIGSQTSYFHQLYVSYIGTSTTGTILYGKVKGSATSLEFGTEFKLQGQITATSFVFSGTGVTATFNTNLMPAAISSQTTFTATNDLSFLALNTFTNSLGKITYPNLIKTVFLSGMITAYGTSTNIPSGWLLCDGTSYSTSSYSTLYEIIGSSFGATLPNMFKVPDYTTTATGGFTIFHIIKT